VSFAEKTQTIIIFDWDDTLFPSTYVRDDLRLSPRLPLTEQQISQEQKKIIGADLAKCVSGVEQLLRLAVSLGEVALVTLARRPWVTDSCKHFYPGIQELIESLSVKIIYAAYTPAGERIDHSVAQSMCPEDATQYFAKLKGAAIARELKSFYSQYEGQSWKNILSIGDSNFERLGTLAAAEEYMVEEGIAVAEPGCSSLSSLKSLGEELEVCGHVYKVRAKTFKMLDEPTADELVTELSLFRRWLPVAVHLDAALDVNLNDVEDADEIKAIEDVLYGRKAPEKHDVRLSSS
jgi:hypothetical protein